MKNLNNGFITINESCFLIDLNSFKILRFISSYVVVRRSIYNDCQIFKLEFIEGLFKYDEVFLSPYINKYLSYSKV